MYWDRWYRFWSHLGDKIRKDEARYFSTLQRCIFIRKMRYECLNALPWMNKNGMQSDNGFRGWLSIFRESARLCTIHRKRRISDFSDVISTKNIAATSSSCLEICCSHKEYFSVSITQLLAQMTLSHESAWHYQKSRELVTMIMNHRFGAFWLYFPHI